MRNDFLKEFSTFLMRFKPTISQRDITDLVDVVKKHQAPGVELKEALALSEAEIRKKIYPLVFVAFRGLANKDPVTGLDGIEWKAKYDEELNRLSAPPTAASPTVRRQVSFSISHPAVEHDVEHGVRVADLPALCAAAYKNSAAEAKRSLMTHCSGYEALPLVRTSTLGVSSGFVDTKPTTAPQWHGYSSGLQFVVMQPTAEKWVGDESKKPIVIAVKGTEPPFFKKGTFLKDMAANIRLWWDGKSKDQQRDLDAAVAESRRRYPERPIIVVGHSLGGSLANHAVATALTAAPTADIRAVTFGDPGVSMETRKKIIAGDHSSQFIAFQNTRDPIAGSLGSHAGGASYSLSSSRGHFIDTYFFGKRVSSRVAEVGAVDISGNALAVHKMLFEKEVARLQATDSSYAKKGEKTAKLWLAEKVLAMTAGAPPSAEHVHWFGEIMRMQRSSWWKPSSASRGVPNVLSLLIKYPVTTGKHFNGFSEIKIILDAQIERLQKNDHKYAGTTGETLKLTMFKSLRAELDNPASDLLGEDRQPLQDALNAIFSMHRSEGRLSFGKESSVASSPAGSPAVPADVATVVPSLFDERSPAGSPRSPGPTASSPSGSPTGSSGSTSSGKSSVAGFWKTPKPPKEPAVPTDDSRPRAGKR